MYVVRESDEFTKWLSRLNDRSAKARIAVRLSRIAQGNLGDYKSLGNNLFEFRITYGPGYRLYFSRAGQTIVVLLMGGDKSSQSRDIDKARNILKGLE